MATGEYIPTKDVAKIIRAELTKAFPGTKFSVRTQSSSGGSHVDVGWTDGPAPRQVDAVIGWLSGKTFDGMDDSTHYHDTPYQGRLVHFGGSRPSTQRDVTQWEQRHAAALLMIRDRCHLEGEPGREQFGRQWIDDLARAMVHGADYRRADALAEAFRRVVLREEGAA
jgi:conjugative element/phage-associated large polyvalent protein